MRYIWRIITSYPMRIVDHCYFVDKVSGRNVLLWEDRHGVRWMAEGRWDLNRVPASMRV